ncbi:hypothetical protein DRO64_03505 [Candidatus Bathyarchaeota archaeon]|nr:MAG: hypothetical protein DRO64_03505 [Candidatus Bathyarchaeota archaeon]
MSPLVNADESGICDFHAGIFDVTFRKKDDPFDTSTFQRGIPICFLLVVSADGKQRFAKFFPKEREDILEAIGLTITELKEEYDIKINRLLVTPKLSAAMRFVPTTNSSRGVRKNLAVKLAGGIKSKIYVKVGFLAEKQYISYEELPNYPQLILEQYVKTMKFHRIKILNDPLDLIPEVEAVHKKKKTILLKVTFESGQVEDWNPSPYKFYRKIELRIDQTLHDLATAIQDALGWEKDHLYCFFKPHSGMLPYSTNTAYVGGYGVDIIWGLPVIADKVKEAAKVKISSLSLGINDTFMYLFDFGDENYFNIEVIGFGETSPWFSYPRLRDKRGYLKQYPGNS